MPDSFTKKSPVRAKVTLSVELFIFIIVLLYASYFAVSYFTKEHVSICMVEMGSLVHDDQYRGIAVRDETIYDASSSGVVNYYTAEGGKVGSKTLVYSLDSAGKINSLINSSDADKEFLTTDDYEDLENTLKDYSSSYSDMGFGDVYDMKSAINTAILDDMNKNALEMISSSDGDISSLNLVYAEKDGIIAYYTDGFESLAADEVTADLLDTSSYSPIYLENNMEVSAGDHVYKLIDDEHWEVVINVSEDTARTLKDMESVKVTFLSDNNWAYATVDVRDVGDDHLVTLSFVNSMVRYVDERFLDIKLTLDQVTGLKVPNTAITEEDFYTVPKEYLTKGGDSDGDGFLVESDESAVFKAVDVYHEDDDYYYISKDDLDEEDVLILPDSDQRYKLSTTKALTGVYNINKGYAVFTQVRILYKNNDYSIVESNSDYGLCRFDYIALDADTISDGEIVN